MTSPRDKKTKEPVRSLLETFHGLWNEELTPDPKLQTHEELIVPDNIEIAGESFSLADFERARGRASRLMGKLLPSAHATPDHPGADDLNDFRAAGEEALEYGNWWHESMQYLPWKSGLEQIARYRSHRLGLLESERLKTRAENEWRLFQDSGLFQRLTSENVDVFVETPFSRIIDEMTYQDGVIDLVWITSDGRARVVDWKTDAFGGRAPDERAIEKAVSGYRSQLEAYQAALNEYGFNVCSVSLWFTASGKQLNLHGED